MPLCPAAFLAAALAAVVPSASAQGAAASQPQAGRCTGAAGPEKPVPSGGAPVDVRLQPSLKEKSALAAFALAGYRADERTGRLLGAGGAPLTQAGLAFLLAPADFSKERVAIQLWGGLGVSYRMDETRCALADRQGRALTRLEYYAARQNTKLALEQATLEKLAARLARLSPGAPVPPDLKAEMRSMAAADAGLPAKVQQLLDKRGLTVGDLDKSTLQAYAGSTRFFDNQRTIGDFIQGALPPVEGLTVHRLPAFSEPEDRRLGALLREDLLRRFWRTGMSDDVIGHLTDKSGRPDLPPILIGKLTQRPEDGFALAIYQDATRTVTMNHWTTVQVLLDRMPPEERARRARDFADPRKLREYLEYHPKEREDLLDGIDEIFYHEFVHAWQARRDGLSLENLRGNVGHAYPVEWELEAFREQCRYQITKAAGEPLSLARAYGGPGFCVGMLKSFDAFEDTIRLIYNQQSVRANGAETLPDIRALQRTRESMARRLMNDGLFQKAVQALKLQGMLRADEKIDEMAHDDAQRKRRFIAQRLPGLRAIAARFPEKLIDEGRLDLAAVVLENLPPSTPGMKELQGRLYRSLAPRLIRPDKTFTLEQRLPCYDAMRNPNGGVWGPELFGAYWRDALLAARQFRAAGQGAVAARWEGVLSSAEKQIAKLRENSSKLRDAKDRAAWLNYAAQLEAQLKAARRQAAAGGRP